MKSFTQTLSEMDELAGFLSEDIDNIRRVIEFCREKDLDVEFEIHAKAETCQESVQHSPVEMDQIVKTLVFIADEPVAVLCPGDRRVDESKLEDLTGTDVRMANPGEVEEATGYVIGGVSPFDLDIPVYMEESVLKHEMVRPAAGSRAVGANIDPEELKKAVDPEVVKTS
jgi:prolyl-tRNA editing enzyme YbaK/EbsC (Cys-tRNA(Pro) deacylase)